MSAAAQSVYPALAGTAPPPARPPSFLKAIRLAKDNAFDTVPLAAYEQPLYRQSDLFGSVLFVSDPDGARRVLVDNVANYPKNAMEMRFFAAMFGEGLLGIDGELWRRHRKVMARSFDPRSVAGYAPAMAETTKEYEQLWDRLDNGREVNIAEEMRALTLQIICRTMFSSDAQELVDIAGTAFGDVQDALEFSVLDVLPVIGPRRMKAKENEIHGRFAIMDAAIYRMIAAREKNLADAPVDLLTRLIAARDPDDGAGLKASEVRDELVTIFMAGHETTALTMTWTWYLLSQHPAVEAKLCAELDAVLGGRPPTADDIPKLPYARMVIEEAMRLYPPAPSVSARVAQAEDKICGEPVAAGQQVIVAPWILHRHHKLWNDPLRFDPERFAPERSAERPRFAYMPFGAGPRICIGAALAMTEATIILAILAQRYRLRLQPGQDIRLQTRITLRPRDGIRMTLARR